MKTICLTIFYPANLYHNFKELMHNINSHYIYYAASTMLGKNLVCLAPPEDSPFEYKNLLVTLRSSDFFVPANLKEYLSNPDSSYELTKPDGKVLYRTGNKKNVSKEKCKYDRYPNVDLWFDENNLVIYAELDNKDDDAILAIEAVMAWINQKGFDYEIAYLDHSFDEKMYRVRLKTKEIKKEAPLKPLLQFEPRKKPTN